MDWTRPINVLIPGLEGHVLQRLWLVDAPQTAREIHQRARTGSVNGVRYALGRLADQGLVVDRQIGNSRQYTLNTQHLAYPALKTALETYDPYLDLRDRLTSLTVNRWPHNVPEPNLSIYGSVTRQTADVDSDLDLLLIIRDEDQDTAHLEDLSEALQTEPEIWTGNPVHLYTTTRRDLHRAHAAGDPIVASWLATADVVTGVGVNRILLEESAA